MKNIRKISMALSEKVCLKTFPVILVLSIFVAQQSLGQIADDFSDGDFTVGQSWSGNSSHFIINTSGQLQLNNTQAATSYLSIPFSIASGETEWQFYVRQNFAGSGSNFGRVYLTSDAADLTQPLNGYYVQFGEGGSNDAVELFRQTGLSSVSVCRATNGGIAAAFAMRCKISRSEAGTWQIFIDYTGGTNFLSEATGLDAIHTSSSFFGIRCNYTLTNANRFFYDDFSIVQIAAPDVTAPQLMNVSVVSSASIDLTFSEALDQSSAENTSNYSTTGEVHPISASLNTEGKVLNLLFGQPFTNGVVQTITVQEIKDIAGNILTQGSHDFLYFNPVAAAKDDIIITEIFADPAPPVSLPEAEFIELYNRSIKPFDLSNWIFTDGSTTGILSSMILLPGEHVILSTASSLPAFASSGKTMSLAPFPSLNNTGDALVLRDPTGLTIDSVNYSNAWYRDDNKTDGGWSLEIIDPENVCEDSENWTASEDEKGGTPGKKNSVFARKPDLAGPWILSAFPLTSSKLEIRFNEKLEETLPDINALTIDPIAEISNIVFADASLTVLRASLLTELQGGTKYSLIANNIRDCAGNVIAEEHRRQTFALPEPAQGNDVVINEILFNPRPTGFDFVEAYNQSEKYINLKNWKIANLENAAAVNAKVISEKDFILEPKSYIVFTKDGNVLKGEYPGGIEETFFEMELPSFPDDEGSVVLIDENDNILDGLSYSDQLHSIFIRDEEGVSLECIDVNNSSADIQNWKSASGTAGFATPGYRNSNSGADGFSESAVHVDPEVFIPVNGQPDFAQIRYNFDRGGFVANVKILDPQGREIKRLANNELIGTDGFFRWDGDQENGGKARIGAYMVLFEVFDAGGTVKSFRKRVVIAGRY